jgi:hypothetical protein
MFRELFANFQKRELPALKTELELINEFEKIKRAYASIASSNLYKLLKEYFETKIEINRDALEVLGLDQSEKIRVFQAEIKVMRAFIQDIEGMMADYEREVLETQQTSIPEAL